ncbi:protein POOR HOMOLOGOUS SYNAPSIS 1 [Actinidia eriantha]|uniref:protein POOR HOMOLOGOUS SYNAPSIS 1 n=1 Tax=Actinidia eriantha TaxID=165200 RepID=UPI002590F725|nr:protein POOR HOMOLOGOUS SYNAPSIS 1 [Actinidia eriantha]
MAGTLVATRSGYMKTTIGEQWEVQYSRFFNSPSLSSTHPSLTPLRYFPRDRLRGTWLSSSSTVSLNLTADLSNSKIILTVAFLGKIYEEHYISRLLFSWPHVSCVSGFPPRGSRVVFASYKDCLGQIQKFALRFPTNYEIETFMNALKEIMDGGRDNGVPCSNFVSGTSSQSDLVPSDEPYRPAEDWNSVDTYTPQMQSSLNYEITQTSNSQENLNSVDTYTHQMQSSLNYEAAKSSTSHDTAQNRDFESIFAAYPPNFTSLVMGCHPVVEQGAAQPTVPGDTDLKLQITRYLGDSSFQDMLIKVERVVGELGYDLML